MKNGFCLHRRPKGGLFHAHNSETGKRLANKDEAFRLKGGKKTRTSNRVSFQPRVWARVCRKGQAVRLTPPTSPGTPSLALWCCFALCWAGPLFATDWPQWRGPNRDAIWTESGI